MAVSKNNKRITAPMTTELDNILVLGYYDRDNLGDEQYKLTFPTVLKYNTISFKSPEDITELPENTTVVIVGGGDVINDYFMQKIQILTKNFIGKIYAVSVGIPYNTGTKYLYLFDHIFTRSQTDYELAVSKVGPKNVSLCRDLAFTLKLEPNRRMTPLTRIGICFANSYFNNNPNKQQLFDSILHSLTEYYLTMNSYTIFHFIPFNTHQGLENDNIIHREFADKFDELGIPYEFHDTLTNPIDVLNFINDNIDVNLCMRFHSIIFSAIAGKRFIALYTTTKIDNLLVDIEYNTLFSIRLEVDEKYRPVNVDPEYLLKVISAASTDNQIDVPYIDEDYFKNITNKIFTDKKQSNVLVHTKLDTFENVIISVKRALIKFLNISTLEADEVLTTRGAFPQSDKSYLEIARLLCFIVTGQINHPTVWGFAENMGRNDFVLFDAVKYVWTLHKKAYDDYEAMQVYAPETAVERKTLFNVDYIFNNDFSQYHRSGWSYVIGGLLNFDAPHLLRESDTMIDIYVDRSFHWGKNVLDYLGALPYKNPWYGFIHHTFNITHSNYNCHVLLKIPEFIESLKICKGLFVLSKYLEMQFKAELTKMGIDVPVFTVYHPTEFVTNNFTMEKFTKNTSKKIIQIGAWLRNPYSIYELPLPSRNTLKIHKAALKGKDMNNYFPSKDLENNLEELLLTSECSNDPNCMSRNPMSRDPMCRDPNVNKFNKGLFDSITSNIMSVEVIDKLSNDDYDNLLSNNVVFLNLVDCSAVNTVIECIVRNTPLIVNRHPALEEVLGVNYPGFYSSLYQASQLIQSHYSIYKIYKYLTTLDKSRYKLDTFLYVVQNIILTGQSPPEFNLFIENQKDRFTVLKRFLPKTTSKNTFE